LHAATVITESIGIAPHLSLSPFEHPTLNLPASAKSHRPARWQGGRKRTMNTVKARLNLWIARLPAWLRGLGPYAAIELLLPGGSLIAMLIWLYRRRANALANVGGP
jgi:hypothetical protein